MLEEAVATLGKLPKRKPITVAKVMSTLRVDTRTAIRLLTALERIELLERSGGEPGECLLWSRTNA